MITNAAYVLEGAYARWGPVNYAGRSTDTGIFPRFPGSGDRFDTRTYHSQPLRLAVPPLDWWAAGYLVEVPPTGGGGFDAAFMAAMNCPWPNLVRKFPEVVASGSAPSERILD